MMRVWKISGKVLKRECGKDGKKREIENKRKTNGVITQKVTTKHTETEPIHKYCAGYWTQCEACLRTSLSVRHALTVDVTRKQGRLHHPENPGGGGWGEVVQRTRCSTRTTGQQVAF